MALIDAETATAREYEICIIGAGAAGLAMAFALGQAGRAVLLIEQGGFDTGTIAPEDDLHDIRSPNTHDGRTKTNRDAVGGTLHGWGGRCVPFDPEDFAPRAILNGPGWPISYDTYAPWIAPAARFLDTDTRFVEPAPKGWGDVPGLRVDRVERLNTETHAARVQSQARGDEAGFDLIEGTRLDATHWTGPQDARHIAKLDLQRGDERFSIRPQTVVLACGGLETTRMMLLAQAAQHDLFGGAAGPLGRFYMGHLTGSVATLHLHDPTVARYFAFSHSPDLSSPYRRRLVLTEGATLHTAFWLENLPPDAADHRSGEISLKHLLAQRGRSRHLARHLGNILRDPLGVGDAIRSVAAGFRAGDTRRPPRLITRPGGLYRLAYHGEHLPLAHSRVTLSDARDRQGRRKLSIDFHYGDATIEALVRDHHTLAAKLDHAGLGRLDMPPDETLKAAIIARARDGYHQAGLARMSALPGDGVVDPDCRAHGTQNLFLASAAVFPVSGQANPTLSAVALALRLADHLSKR